MAILVDRRRLPAVRQPGKAHRRPSTAASFWCACWSLLALAGCAKSDLVPASGRIEIDGRPLAKATLTLMPQSGKGQPAWALSAADGTFELHTGNALGAHPGGYRVLVTKEEPGEPAVGTAPSEPPPDEPTRAPARLIGEATTAELGQGMQQLSRFPVRSLIPTRYASPAQSPLECDVPAAGTRTLRFELYAR